MRSPGRPPVNRREIQQRDIYVQPQRTAGPGARGSATPEEAAPGRARPPRCSGLPGGWRGAPDGAHLVDREADHLGGASLGEEPDGLAAIAGEDLVGDDPLAVPGEDLDRGPVDQDVQAQRAVAQSERGPLHTGEGGVEADVARLRPVDEELTVVDVVADHGLLVAA